MLGRTVGKTSCMSIRESVVNGRCLQVVSVFRITEGSTKQQTGSKQRLALSLVAFLVRAFVCVSCAFKGPEYISFTGLARVCFVLCLLTCASRYIFIHLIMRGRLF